MSRIKNKLAIKSRDPIKVKKQQLCDRINQCKSLKELEEWEQVFSYYPVLKKDEDWDYDFLLDLMYFKLRRMSQYFHTHRIVADEDWYGTLCDRAIAILKAGYKTDIILVEDLNGIYVNDRNVNRFFTPKQLSFIMKNELQKYYLPFVRQAKAKALLWKFLHHYIEILWD